MASNSGSGSKSTDYPRSIEDGDFEGMKRQAELTVELHALDLLMEGNHFLSKSHTTHSLIGTSWKAREYTDLEDGSKVGVNSEQVQWLLGDLVIESEIVGPEGDILGTIHSVRPLDLIGRQSMQSSIYDAEGNLVSTVESSIIDGVTENWLEIKITDMDAAAIDFEETRNTANFDFLFQASSRAERV